MTSSLPKSTRCDPCVLCEGTEFEVLSQHDRKGRPLTTALCGRCGLVSHEAIPNDDQLAEYYARHYRIDYHGEYSPSARRVLREWRRGNELVQHLSHPSIVSCPSITATPSKDALRCTAAFALRGYKGPLLFGARHKTGLGD